MRFAIDSNCNLLAWDRQGRFGMARADLAGLRGRLWLGWGRLNWAFRGCRGEEERRGGLPSDPVLRSIANAIFWAGTGWSWWAGNVAGSVGLGKARLGRLGMAWLAGIVEGGLPSNPAGLYDH
ncbi:hypothetical protein PPACK8108_LOCUS7551 [Phakopsora pachyrhizi]|uniref:Uncharacterized protein n=1 Tax=Phakopsora pachyrhizi TaxID=170000 RepID=A0AAV0AVU2_PHAPC|nr:hypothetical protein PPACK8108_LOCUS7551 [Phakopsora pachyrhizi]